MSKEQQDWFNALPLRQLNRVGERFERTCSCDETVWYEIGNEIHLHSWIDRHFPHREIDAADNLPTGEMYDFTRAIKFSHVGFSLFAEERGLQTDGVIYHSEPNLVSFTGADGKKWAFTALYRDFPTKNEAEGVAFVYNPKVSGHLNGQA